MCFVRHAKLRLAYKTRYCEDSGDPDSSPCKARPQHLGTGPGSAPGFVRLSTISITYSMRLNYSG